MFPIKNKNTVSGSHAKQATKEQLLYMKTIWYSNYNLYSFLLEKYDHPKIIKILNKDLAWLIFKDQ